MILGVDLGEKTTGLATSDSLLASPYKTISHKNIEEAQKQVIRIIDQEKIDTVVVGFVEGKIKPMFTNFAKKLQDQKIKRIVFDRGGYQYHGNIKKIAEGLRKLGLEF